MCRIRPLFEDNPRREVLRMRDSRSALLPPSQPPEPERMAVEKHCR